MNVIFLTITRFNNLEGGGIYVDLMRKFKTEGNNVYVIYPNERRYNMGTSFQEIEGINFLGVRTLNLQKTNVIEKGLGTVSIENLYSKAINKYLHGVKFDLILYSTPPITFPNLIRRLKRYNNQSVTYLLLKDIFPQNAVDLKMLRKGGVLYKYFRRKEMNLYKSSDYIGCMSPANVEYFIRHNSFYPSSHVEVAPNSIELQKDEMVVEKIAVRKRYNLPIDKVIFVYGGNLGKPQGIDFLIECLDANSKRNDCHFVIVGDGTEYHKLHDWFDSVKPDNVSLMKVLSKQDYDTLVRSCDAGLIFLDYRFTIPNYPSRLLSYLEYKIPIIAATDVNTDIGLIAEQNKYGYWCPSNDVSAFTNCVNKYLFDKESINTMGNNGYRYLLNNYLTENTYNTIISHLC